MNIQGEDFLLTVILRHDQSQNLDELQDKLDVSGWWKQFPPEGVEVVSWNVVMSIGQIITLKLPPNKLQAVNIILERCAWGVFETECYPTYDFIGTRERLVREFERRSEETGKPLQN